MNTGVTHPEGAALIQALPIALTIAAVLLLTILFQGQLVGYVQRRMQRAVAQGQADVDPALTWYAAIMSPLHLLGACLVAGLLVFLAISGLAPLFLAQALASSATLLLLWGLLWVAERRYVARLDAQLPAAVSRFAAQLAGSNSFRPALEKVWADLPESPLKAEWLFILERIGAPLADGSLATATDVVMALQQQTPSRRHATLLGHLETALRGERHDMLIARMEAASSALHKQEQRRSAAKTELSRIRIGGIVIASVGILINAYLLLIQPARMAKAYSGTLGMIAAVWVTFFLVLPLVGGFVLARADDVDY